MNKNQWLIIVGLVLLFCIVAFVIVDKQNKIIESQELILANQSQAKKIAAPMKTEQLAKPSPIGFKTT